MLYFFLWVSLDVTIDQENWQLHAIQRAKCLKRLCFFFNNLSCQNYFFQRGEGGGKGGVILVIKTWKFRGVGGGAYVKFPPWWGAHISWKAHILDTLCSKDHLSEVTINQKTEKTELIIYITTADAPELYLCRLYSILGCKKSSQIDLGGKSAAWIFLLNGSFSSRRG